MSQKQTSVELTLHLPSFTSHKVSFSIPFSERSSKVSNPKIEEIEFHLHKKIISAPDCGYKAICVTYNLTDYAQKLTLR